ncbi:MAG: hypothetical protein FWF28_08195 [Micrococcales bacterium]|nr:hypothetical protein [Micrococcales bacterium]
MNRVEHLMVCLMEECAEVQKAAAKALRFGLTDRNVDDLYREYVDVEAVFDLLADTVPSLGHGTDETSERKRIKADKVDWYMRQDAAQPGRMT